MPSRPALPDGRLHGLDDRRGRRRRRAAVDHADAALGDARLDHVERRRARACGDSRHADSTSRKPRPSPLPACSLDDDGAAPHEQRHHAQRLQARHALTSSTSSTVIEPSRRDNRNAERGSRSPMRLAVHRHGDRRRRGWRRRSARRAAGDRAPRRRSAPPDSPAPPRRRRRRRARSPACSAASARPERMARRRLRVPGSDGNGGMSSSFGSCDDAPYEVYCAIFDACAPRMNGLVGLVPPSSTSSGPLRSGATSSGRRFKSA